MRTYEQVLQDYDGPITKARRKYTKLYKRYRLGQATAKQVLRAKAIYDSLLRRQTEASLIAIIHEVDTLTI